MPIKKDDTGRRWVEMEVTVPGTPEQVWNAMATGPGTQAWFTTTTIEERVGGEIRFDFGANGSSVGEVTAWEPPRRFGYIERNWSEGAPPVATEITITSRTDDRCVVRMVHSLFSSSDAWDDQMEGFENGWPAFFDVLRLYLTHFAGHPAACCATMTTVDAEHPSVWKRLMDQLALGGADVGDRRTTPREPERLSGVVARLRQHEQERLVVMRLDEPAPGVALIGTFAAAAQVMISVNLYFYGEDAATRAAASGRTWQAWLAERFVPELSRA